MRRHALPTLRRAVPLILALLLVSSAAAAAGLNGDSSYTNGPQVCGTCHPEAFDDWLAHGHSREIGQGSALGSFNGALGLSADARAMGIPLPDHDPKVYNWDNILFVLGASKHWKTLFVGGNGYILTRGGKNQYNWETSRWVDYRAGEKVPFDCGPCHTTGYRDPDEVPGAGFNGVPGIVGDFAQANITCEACHGPGARHAKTQDPDDVVVDRRASLCAGCHTGDRDRVGDDRVGEEGAVVASDGFIHNRGQYEELQKGAHTSFPCVVCHDAHVGRTAGIKTYVEEQAEVCDVCHLDQAAEYAGSTMEKAGVRCQDCHMGRATRSALANGPYEGDVWTHLFLIDSRANYDMFHRDGDGNAVSAKGALSLEYACFRCHADADKAAFAALGGPRRYHTLGK